MGIEIMRVPADFDWPLRQRWSGYLMPEGITSSRCPDCDGDGCTPAYMWAENTMVMLANLGADPNDQKNGHPMHPYFDDYYGERNDRPTEDIHTFLSALSGGEYDASGPHLSTAHAIMRKMVEVSGLGDDWGRCPTCNGEGNVDSYPGQPEGSVKWEVTEPPAGNAYQLWENVTEGSPVSPVFENVNDFTGWLTSSEAGRYQMTREGALALIDSTWAPSATYHH